MAVNFDRHLNELQPLKKQNRVTNRSPFSGVTEFNDFFEEESVHVLAQRIKPDLIDALEEWYRYAKDGSMFDFEGDRDLGLFLGFEGKSLLTNDEASGTFTRSGVAYVEDPDTGLLTSIAENTARFPAGKFGRGVLVEPLHWNLLIKSAAFDDVAWTASSITVAANTTEVDDPLGTNTAEKLTTTGANGTLTQTTAEAIGTNSGHFSVYLRSVVSGAAATLYIKDSSGATLATQAITLTTKWARYFCHYVNTAAANANNWRVVIEFTATAKVHYVFGAQLEAGFYSCSYVPTDAAAAMHGSELLIYPLEEGVSIDHYQGSVAFWLKSHFSHDDDGASGSLPIRYFMDFADAANATVFRLARDTSGKIHAYVTLVDASVVGVDDDFTMERDTWTHIVLTYDFVAASGVFTIYINGAALSAHAEAGGLTNEITQMSIGTLIGGTGTAPGIYDDIIVRRDVMTAPEVKALYDKGRSAGHRRNRFENCVLLDPEFSPIVNQGGNVFDFEADFTVNPT